MDRPEVVRGLLIPFIGTTLGAAMVFFLKNKLSDGIQGALEGFAAGVMTAASVWSLLIPSIEQSAAMGRLAFVPAAAGFWIGVGLMILLDRLIPRLRVFADRAAGRHRTTMMILAVTLHNIPEGMAVGAMFAGLVSGSPDITVGGALALSLGIAVQNLPEGAIISLPLRAGGKGRLYAFFAGMMSGAVEPVAAAITMLAAGQLIPMMPLLLSAAAGAMMYVVVYELIPETSGRGRSISGVLTFAMGFCVMMILDVALG